MALFNLLRRVTLNSPSMTRVGAGLTGALLACLMALASCSGSLDDSLIDRESLIAATANPEDWAGPGRTYDESRFSPLTQINAENADQLGIAWYADIDTDRGVEASPLIIDGTLYNTEPWNVTKAYNAVSGELLWSFDPEVPRETARIACCDIVTRGLAAWQDKLYSATLDGRLIALDRATGQRLWSVDTTEPEWPYTITGAPRVFDGKVLIGNGGADAGARGYVTAYDAESGEQLWRFYTVPGNPEDGFENEAMRLAASTWTGEYWKLGAGGTVWDSIVYDPELKLIYIGVGNGSPWSQQERSPQGGDNLYLSSIVALHAETGEYAWHFQTTPAEEWDYTATQPMILADLEIGGRARQVIMQAPKNGFFYVLDRATGEFISGEPYVPVTWASGLNENGRPVETGTARYGDGAPLLVSPTAGGGHNWHPMSYSPLTGLVYFPVTRGFMPIMHDADFTPRVGKLPNYGARFRGSDVETPEFEATARANNSAWLTAWDPVRQQEVWRVPYSLYGSGGVLSTAGNLVFQGTIDSTFAAYRADNGQKVWEMPVQQVPMAGPVSFMVDGTQYVAVNTGWGGGLTHGSFTDFSGLTLGKNRLIVFKLGGTASLPPYTPLSESVLSKPTLSASLETVERGAALYQTTCSSCHGEDVRGGVKDLRYLSTQTHSEFLSIVREGARQEKGMPNFGDTLSKSEAEAIHQYIISRTIRDWAEVSSN